MESPCIRYTCVQCCFETEMPLLKKDIERIQALGFTYEYFVVNRDHWLQLKNHDGRCVFHDGKQCSIYENRPEGCKTYPIVYDADKKGATLDEECPHRNEFTISEIDRVQLLSLIAKLNNERKQRKEASFAFEPPSLTKDGLADDPRG
jgi:Fe-S-cluster containining protein